MEIRNLTLNNLNTISDPLKNLQQLLLSEIEKRIKKLETVQKKLGNQLNNREEIIQTISPVLTELLGKKIHDSKDELANTLSPIMSKAIKKQVAESKEDVVDALYPIIGRMISKSITEAMKKLVASVNDSINQKLNFKIWVKNIKARIFGVGLAEMVIAEEMPFVIKQVFLIAKNSGLLISHVSRNKNGPSDPNIVAGMLTAIRSFMQDAFSPDKAGELYEIEYSDQTIHIESGRYTYLAVVYKGIAPANLSDQLKHIQDKIRNRYYKYLRNFQEQNTHLIKIETILEEIAERYN
ncbi:MAG: hypothetical protein JW976_00585 [Syntrophaceae bacterium]|nr:hypothetical protein [Syntrophaceae bacterium]